MHKGFVWDGCISYCVRSRDAGRRIPRGACFWRARTIVRFSPVPRPAMRTTAFLVALLACLAAVNAQFFFHIELFGTTDDTCSQANQKAFQSWPDGHCQFGGPMTSFKFDCNNGGTPIVYRFTEATDCTGANSTFDTTGNNGCFNNGVQFAKVPACTQSLSINPNSNAADVRSVLFRVLWVGFHDKITSFPCSINLRRHSLFFWRRCGCLFGFGFPVSFAQYPLALLICIYVHLFALFHRFRGQSPHPLTPALFLA